MQLAPRLPALAFVAALAALGCSKSRTEARPAPAEPAAPMETAPAPTAPVAVAPAPIVVAQTTSLPADFPPACVAYAAMIDKLQTCDKIGEGRDGLTRGYDELRSTWAMASADQRDAFDAQCKIQADSLRDAVAATCSW